MKKTIYSIINKCDRCVNNSINYHFFLSAPKYKVNKEKASRKEMACTVHNSSNYILINSMNYITQWRLTGMTYNINKKTNKILHGILIFKHKNRKHWTRDIQYFHVQLPSTITEMYQKEDESESNQSIPPSVSQSQPFSTVVLF